MLTSTASCSDARRRIWKPALRPARHAVGGEIEAERVRGVEKQFLRRKRQQDMRVADVESDVAPSRRLVAQRVEQGFVRREGLPEEKPSPAALQHEVPAHAARCRPRRAAPSASSSRPACASAGSRRRAAARSCGCRPCSSPVPLALDHMPWFCSHSSRSPACHSSEPRSGVMCSEGASNSASR